MDGEVSASELRDLRDSEMDVTIVDVRPPSAFEHGRIPDSVNVPLPRLTGQVDELDSAERVVTVCPHGQASVQAARLIAAYEGIEGPVESLACGLEGWDGDIEASE